MRWSQEDIHIVSIVSVLIAADLSRTPLLSAQRWLVVTLLVSDYLDHIVVHRGPQPNTSFPPVAGAPAACPSPLPPLLVRVNVEATAVLVVA